MQWINDGTRVPIANWATSLENDALEQAKALANLDSVFHHVSLMPDAHPGMGMPIGGVIACKDVVIPNAVGVDIGCVDKETEYLSIEGWKKISEYENDKILVFDKNTNSCFFEIPQKYIVLPCDKFYHIKTNYGIDQMLCSEHNLLLVKGSHNREKSRGKYYDIKMEQMFEINKKLKLGIRDKFLSIIPNISNYSYIDLSDIELRIQIMVMADGHFVNNTQKCRCNFKKDRKIKRAEKLLNNANIPFEKKQYKDITEFYFIAPQKEKRISSFWKASKDQLKIICDEVLNWDGTVIKRDCFFSKYKEDADFIQYAFATCGRRSTISYDNRIGKEGYRVLISKTTMVGIDGSSKDNNIKEVPSVDGLKYCFTTSTGYWIMRRNNCITVTGNCGMAFLETNIPVNEIKSINTTDGNLIKTIIKTIYNNIPSGKRHHKEQQNCFLLENPPEEIMHISIVKNEIESAKFQVGTLGGGNHFIELQQNEAGNLCLMLHSGSRNFGYKIANHFNALAQEIGGFKYRGDSGLAELDVNSKDGKDYLLAMNFALDFAKENRRLMLEKFKSIVFNLLKKYSTITNFEILSEVNIHHNYAAIEEHFGENVWVHRKGAICMTEGAIGIIPGSMGTSSYIVKGKGNKNSFCSASHGAGRVMGRNAFNKQYSLEKAEKSMEGIEYLGWSVDRKGKLDFSEAPEAYKNIDDVINAELDLVDVVMKLKPIGSVKELGWDKIK